ncbi:alpha/beta hydrolase [Actinophytocola sp.]|uniref:alpha/beta hydrolase n=1 Tax=Actinophytocola sp. TaxID=1872138 RepID=UPI002D7E4093|nr:alpha/beta hydrolase [Actinophytocola sp.]HET9142526.1 alpha/beta hydrolase [Actinophytocola sp.]
MLAACTTTSPGTAVAPDIERRGPTGPVPPGLEKFYGQSLSWGECAPYARTDFDRAAMKGDEVQCTRLTVPLDYAKPDGETISIAVLRRPAGDSERRIGSLLINPGGPGASGLATAARLGQEARNDLGERFDFVGFDPRGVGASEPVVKCLTDQERDAERAEDDELDASAAGVAKVESDEKDYAAKCAERTGKGAAMLANLGTRDVARDMDVLRSTLGDEKLTYLGYSYGTRLGSTYAEAFPNNVRAMVLDGALDPSQDPVEELVAQGEGFQKAFDDFVSWCVQRQDCALGQDRAKALDAFLALVRPLGQRPVEVDDGRKLSYSDAMTGVIQALYADELWEYLNTGLTELKGNRADTLMQLADTYLERGPDGRYSSTQDAFTAIRCVDDPRVTDKNVVLEAARRYKQVAPFLDDGNPPTATLDSCAFWPVPNTGQPHLPNVAGVPPVLVVSTTKDPATPYEAGVNLAKALGGGLLTFEGTQHTAFLQDNKCVDEAGARYLVDLKLPAEGTRCS